MTPTPCIALALLLLTFDFAREELWLSKLHLIKGKSSCLLFIKTIFTAVEQNRKVDPVFFNLFAVYHLTPMALQNLPKIAICL
jgi:hypothetical protein